MARSRGVAGVQRTTGDPWRDLNGHRCASEVAKKNGVPMFVVGDLETVARLHPGFRHRDQPPQR
ncbi:MAG: hypothetical protein ACTHQQ_24345 [Solirubrobacteraceae bacterium]